MKKIKNFFIFIFIILFLILIMNYQNKNNIHNSQPKYLYQQLSKNLNLVDISEKHKQKTIKDIFEKEPIIIQKIKYILKKSDMLKNLNISSELLNNPIIIKNILYLLAIRLFSEHKFYNFDFNKMSDFGYIFDFLQKNNIVDVFIYVGKNKVALKTIPIQKLPIQKLPILAIIKDEKEFNRILAYVRSKQISGQYEDLNEQIQIYEDLNEQIQIKKEYVEFIFPEEIEKIFFTAAFFMNNSQEDIVEKFENLRAKQKEIEITNLKNNFQQ
ncbi:hypothetical protein, partial [Candidatus Phytoplasma pini]